MISRQVLHEVSLRVANRVGWDFKPNQMDDLERGLLSTAKEFGVGNSAGEVETWLQNINWTKKELDTLSFYLAVGETYFFREPAWLEVFQKNIITELIRERVGKNQYLRIWSAGCCTGEEPYSIAIMLNDIIPNIRTWKIIILGTDINPAFLAKAREGIYSAWSFRETLPHIKKRYFIHTDNRWQIVPEIKQMVTFASLNLAEDTYPSDLTNTQNMDVIFCRNVLIYFTPEQIRNVGRRFHQSLAKNGWLITGAVELNDNHFSDFSSVKIDQCLFYRKAPKPPHPEMKARTLTRVRHSTSTVKEQIRTHHRAPVSDHKRSTVTDPDAETLFNQGLYEQCAQKCEADLKEKPDDLELMVLAVKSKANLGLLKEARQYAERLTGYRHVSAEHYYLYAHILLEENEITLAESILKRAIYLDPNHLMSHFLLGNIASRNENRHAALKHYRNAKELLQAFKEDDIVPGSDGLTAGRIKKLLIHKT